MTNTYRRVQPVGYYGMGNFGDDIFREVISMHGGNIWPAAKIRFFVPHGPGLNSKPTALGSMVRLGQAIAGAAWADTFSLCGGSVLTDVAGNAAIRARLTPIRRFEALGVSIGPFRDERTKRDVLFQAQKFDKLIVRDHASLERSGLSAKVGGDLAALYPVKTFHQSEAQAVTICPSAASGSTPRVFAKRIMDSIGDRDRPIRLLALNFHPTLGDESLCRAIRFELLREGFLAVDELSYRNLGIDGTIATLANSAAVLSERLHGAILAYLTDTPFAIISHHVKCLDFATEVALEDTFVLAPDNLWTEALEGLLQRAADSSPLCRVSAKTYRTIARHAYLRQGWAE